MHLDLAADSVNESPNPQIRDLKIRYTYDSGPNAGKKSGWTKVYGPKLSKILARFQPISRSSKQTGYFVQRSDDNLVDFALANYVQKQIKSYPFLPVIYDKIADAPMLPPKRESIDTVFSADGNNPVTFDDFDPNDPFGVSNVKKDGECPADDANEDLEIGAPAGADQYPQSYKDDRQKWLESVKNDDGSGAGPATCKVDITEVWTCEPVESNLYAEMKITGSGGNTLYSTPGSAHSPGQPINAAHALSIQEEGMPKPLVVVGEHSGDYIQFTYGDVSWKSGDTSGKGHCKLKGNDWDKKGPQGCPNAMASSREFECEYPC